MYKLIKNSFIDEIKIVLNLENNLYIPFDVNNKDYQEYLKWVSEGNQPLPADE